jgi:diguanylate cyclase (GGDEF)-like protein/PAS domain S-box-containing protein
MAEALRRDGIESDAIDASIDGASALAEPLAVLEALLSTLAGHPSELDAARAALQELRVLGEDAESIRQRFVATFNALPDAVTLHDEAGNIIAVNSAACRVFGRSREELQRLNVRDLNPRVAPDRMAQVSREHAEGESFVVETTNVRGDGSEFPVEVHSAVFRDRGQTRVIAIARDLTARRKAESTLRASEARYRQLLHGMDKGIIVRDAAGNVTSVNPAACRALGLEEHELIGKSLAQTYGRALDENGEPLPLDLLPAGRALKERRTIESTVVGLYNPEQHNYVWLSITAVPQFDLDTGEPVQVISTFSDVTELKRDSALFTQTQALARIGGWEWSPARPTLFLTDEFYRILQRTPGEALTFERLIEHVEPNERLRVQTLLNDALVQRHDVELECPLRTARGEARWVRVIGRNTATEGEAPRLGGTLQDITESRAQQESLRRQAATDPLTGLANRDAALEELARALEHAGPERGPALLYVDLDRFKVVNDLLGHSAGDALLAAAGRRLKEVAGEYGMVARFGADEFLVMIPQSLRGVAPMALAEHIAQVFARSFEYGGEEFTLSVSIGLARYPDDGVTVQQLVNNADAAMTDAKRRGRGNWQRFNPALAQQQSDRLLIETQLRRALDQREFHLVYQPQVDMRDGKVQAAEALLRWNNRVLGEMPPDRFIQHAEASGDIVRIGAWVMREACRQLCEWRRQGDDLARVAVNVSFRQFLSEDFVQAVVATLREFGLPGDALELEITERVLVEDAPDTMQTFAALKALGVILTIDDFGEGYSALNYLRRLPIDGLKISHTFLQGVPQDASDTSICSAIIRVAQSLGLNVVAEGVETAEQRDFLLALDTHQCQGYFYSRPVAPAELQAYLRRTLATPD